MPDMDEPRRSEQPSLRKDARENRRKILDAASGAMSELGLSVPMEAIAARAGVGVGTLYRRFPSRADLVEALFEDRMESIIEDAEATFDFEDGWDGFVWFLERIISRQTRDRALGELLMGDAGRGRVAAIRDRLGPLADKIVERAKHAGRLRSDFDTTDLVMIQKMVCAASAATADAKPTVWRRYLTIVLDGLETSRSQPSRQEVGPLTDDELYRTMHSASGSRR